MMVRCCSLQSCCLHITSQRSLCFVSWRFRQQCRESHSSGWFDASVVTRFVSLVSLVNCPVVERLLVVCPPGVGRQALHPSSPPATSAFAATCSEEEGLYARPLPHIFGEYFCVDVPRRRKDWHIPFLLASTVCTSEGEGQALSSSQRQ